MESFVAEFANMRRMMMRNMKGIDLDMMDQDPNAPVQTLAAKKELARKEKKLKPTRGGGGGFGAK